MEDELERLSDDIQDPQPRRQEGQEGQQRPTGAASTLRLLLFKPENLRPLLFSVVLMVGQQLSGVNAVIFFSQSIFEVSKTEL